MSVHISIDPVAPEPSTALYIFYTAPKFEDFVDSCDKDKLASLAYRIILIDASGVAARATRDRLREKYGCATPEDEQGSFVRVYSGHPITHMPAIHRRYAHYPAMIIEMEDTV